MALVNRRILSRAVVVGLLAATVALAGCGRKGPLEAPWSTAADPAVAGAPPPAAPAPKPKKPFFLDPLLK